MENAKLLFDKNRPTSLKIVQMKKGQCIVKCGAQVLNGSSLLDLLYKIHSVLEKYTDTCRKIVIQLSRIRFQDRLVYLTMENICYSLIVDYGVDVEIKLQEKKSIFTPGIIYSPLYHLVDGNTKDFVACSDKKKFVSKNVYRALIPSDVSGESDIFSVIMTDIRAFLKGYYNNTKHITEIAEVVIELCGNAHEHSGSACLVDMFVDNEYVKPLEKNSALYGGINIAIMNLSDKLMGDGIKTKLSIPKFVQNERYMKLSKVYENHKGFFDAHYGEDTFFCISAFQDKISGRLNDGEGGGTGLPKLVRSLSTDFDGEFCYCSSGYDGVVFNSPLLGYDSDGWIGFNKGHDFVTTRPDEQAISQGKFYFPGTGFNLTFVFED